MHVISECYNLYTAWSHLCMTWTMLVYRLVNGVKGRILFLYPIPHSICLFIYVSTCLSMLRTYSFSNICSKWIFFQFLTHISYCEKNMLVIISHWILIVNIYIYLYSCSTYFEFVIVLNSAPDMSFLWHHVNDCWFLMGRVGDFSLMLKLPSFLKQEQH